MLKQKDLLICQSPEMERVNLSSELGRVYQSPEMEIHIVESEGLIASSMGAPTEKGAEGFWSGGN